MGLGRLEFRVLVCKDSSYERLQPADNMTTVEMHPPSSLAHLRLPELQTTGIYTGRYQDRNPQIQAVSFIIMMVQLNLSHEFEMLSVQVQLLDKLINIYD